MSIRNMSNQSLRVIATVSAVVGLTLIGSASTAGATGACGDYSFGFQGTRLINDGISQSAGPFAIQLPAGTYDIVMQSHDGHDDHPGQLEQTQEQWYFVLDSGYQSPFAVDVPEEANTSTTTAAAQVIGDSTSITLHHRGEGGVNSVDPICVGFTLTAAAPVIEEEPEETTPVVPEESEVVVEPEEEVPVETVPEETVPEVVPDEIPEVVSPPTTAVEVIVPEVAGAVQTAPPASGPARQLAVTGPSQLVLLMTLGGLAMLLIGAGIVLDER